jgi:hypothetical protein
MDGDETGVETERRRERTVYCPRSSSPKYASPTATSTILDEFKVE